MTDIEKLEKRITRLERRARGNKPKAPSLSKELAEIKRLLEEVRAAQVAQPYVFYTHNPVTIPSPSPFGPSIPMGPTWSSPSTVTCGPHNTMLSTLVTH